MNATGMKEALRVRKQAAESCHDKSASKKVPLVFHNQGLKTEVRNVGPYQVIRLSGEAIEPAWIEIEILADGSVNGVYRPIKLPNG